MRLGFPLHSFRCSPAISVYYILETSWLQWFDLRFDFLLLRLATQNSTPPSFSPSFFNIVSSGGVMVYMNSLLGSTSLEDRGLLV